MCTPPMPVRFGSTKRSVSFHIGLVKSTTASSRPKIGLCASWLGPQHSRSQRSSASGRRRISRTVRILEVERRQALERALHGERDAMHVGELVGKHRERGGRIRIGSTSPSCR